MLTIFPLLLTRFTFLFCLLVKKLHCRWSALEVTLLFMGLTSRMRCIYQKKVFILLYFSSGDLQSNKQLLSGSEHLCNSNAELLIIIISPFTTKSFLDWQEQACWITTDYCNDSNMKMLNTSKYIQNLVSHSRTNNWH